MANSASIPAQGYVDKLMETKHFTAMALVERTTPVMLATSTPFPLAEEAVQTLLRLNEDSNQPMNTPIQLLFGAAPERYLLVRRHDTGIMLKKGAYGIVTVCTKSYCFIGCHDDKTKAEICLTDMSRVADYFIRHDL